ATSSGGYTYTAAPTITSIAPGSGLGGGGHRGGVFTGANLSGATSVTFAGTAATITNNTSTTITVTTPVQAAGAGEVVVTTTGGGRPEWGGDYRRQLKRSHVSHIRRHSGDDHQQHLYHSHRDHAGACGGSGGCRSYYERGNGHLDGRLHLHGGSHDHEHRSC